MKKIKWIALLLVLTVFMAGCSKQETTTTEDTEPEIVVPYKLSKNPTDLLNDIYNDLSEAYKDGDDEKEAEYVAVYFAADFYTWSNKTGREDIGGVNYVVADQRDSFASTAIRDYYVNFAELTEQYGQENLPEVIDYEILADTQSDFVYDADGYRDCKCKDIQISITYKDSELYDVAELQSQMIVTVMDYNDQYYVVGVDYALA